MMLEVYFENSQEKLPVCDEYIKTCEDSLTACLKYEGHDFDAEVNLIFTDDEEIRDIIKCIFKFGTAFVVPNLVYLSCSKRSFLVSGGKSFILYATVP